MRKIKPETILAIQARVLTCADCKFYNPFRARECAFFNQNTTQLEPICLAGYNQVVIEKGE